MWGILERIKTMPQLGAISAFLVLFIVFSFISPSFVSLRNLTGVLTITSELGIMAIGVGFLMIAGEFDLSVSSVYALSGFIFIVFANNFGFSLGSLLAFLMTLMIAAIIGFLNGIITIRARIPSFITTLGMMLFLRGILLGVTGGSSVEYTGGPIAPKMLTNYIGYRFRPSHLWFIGLALIVAYVLNQTAYGNRVLATGGKRGVARMMGVAVNKVKIINFMVSAVFASVAGMIVISRFSLANASFGTGMELEAIASAVIGGTLMTGGYGTIIGVAFGAIIMGMVRSGLVMAGAPSYWYEAFVGAILIIAAAINLKLSGFKTEI